MEYNLRQLQSGYDLTDPLQKAEFARAGAELLASLDSPVEREVYGRKAAQAASFSPDFCSKASNTRPGRKKS